MKENAKIFELHEMREQISVFRDRAHAGQVMAGMLEAYRGSRAIMLAIPAGGVPVAAPVARELGLTFELAIASKITLPWSTESGYGAVAFDGTVILNEELLPRLGLSKKEISKGIEKTFEKVTRRIKSLRGDRPLPALCGETVILVDDGLASGITMEATVKAVRKAGARELVVAVPTAHLQSIDKFLGLAEAIYCPNIRGGWTFAVASAYEHWCDVSEEEALALLADFYGISESSID